MFPELIFVWKHAQSEICHPRANTPPEPWARCGSGFSGGWGGGGGDACGDSGGGGSFGVRRPLRFLAYKLQLTEAQVGELARILNELKTERAQAEVDDRRAQASFADAVSGPTFDEAAVGQAAEQRRKSAERLQQQVVRALGRIHALLTPEQRASLAYLIRTGTLTL
ncbi:MAG: periplasmic heavy metal sensor [Myxococcales bacterium]|nr:periplasmic heavy metal sensor [Myxococcales bacterium]